MKLLGYIAIFITTFLIGLGVSHIFEFLINGYSVNNICVSLGMAVGILISHFYFESKN